MQLQTEVSNVDFSFDVTQASEPILMKPIDAHWHAEDVGSFILVSGETTFNYHTTPLGVACNFSLGDPTLYSLRRTDGLYRTGLSEGEAFALLHGDEIEND